MFYLEEGPAPEAQAGKVPGPVPTFLTLCSDSDKGCPRPEEKIPYYFVCQKVNQPRFALGRAERIEARSIGPSRSRNEWVKLEGRITLCPLN